MGLGREDAVPDHTTICCFRLRLIAEGLLEKLFAELDRQMEQAGVILKRGTMLDATVIETGASRPPKDDGTVADPDARFTKRQGKAGSSFGYKAHVGVDEGSGVVRSVATLTFCGAVHGAFERLFPACVLSGRRALITTDATIPPKEGCLKLTKAIEVVLSQSVCGDQHPWP